MRNARSILLVLVLLAGFSGCTTLSPELVRELVKDHASACFTTDVRGGAGGIMGGATGGYGQATVAFCRMMDTAKGKITLKPDGTIIIEHSEADVSED